MLLLKKKFDPPYCVYTNVTYLFCFYSDRITNKSLSICDLTEVNSNRVIILRYEDYEGRNLLYYIMPLQQDEPNLKLVSPISINTSSSDNLHVCNIEHTNQRNSDQNSSLVIESNDNIINETETMSLTEDIYNIEHVEQRNRTSREKNEDSLSK